jgi:hypothetical protein
MMTGLNYAGAGAALVAHTKSRARTLGHPLAIHSSKTQGKTAGNAQQFKRQPFALEAAKSTHSSAAVLDRADWRNMR